MGEAFKAKKIRSPFAIFFQIPVFSVATFGLYNLIEKIFYSFASVDTIGNPTFAGLENYSNVFKNELTQKCLSNTIFMVCAVSVLLVLTAVLPAIFTARLKLPFGIGIMCAFSLISLCAMLPNFFNIFFSGDSYGILNSWLLSESLISTPILFKQTYAMAVAIIVLWLYCLAPVFSITYIAVKTKHGFLGTTIAVCLVPILMYNGGSLVSGIVGYPSKNNAADWLYTVFKDYLLVRFDIGFAYALLIIGLAMLVGWCVLICSLSFGVWKLCKRINTSTKAFNVFGLVSVASSVQLFLLVLIFIITYLSKAFMPIDELLMTPNTVVPIRPTLQNFSVLSELTSNLAIPFSHYLRNSLFIVPLTIISSCFSVALPSGVGFGLFKAFKKQRLLLLCFIPFLFVSGYIAFNQLGIINSYSVYMFNFLSSFELLMAVFLVYLAINLVFYNSKPHIPVVLLGIFFLLSSFYALGTIRGIWYGDGAAVYDENLKLWKDITTHISSGGIARYGVFAANDILMLLITIAVVTVPLILLLILYLSYRRNLNTTTKTFCENKF